MANNSSNLRPPTAEEARERGRKGGIASGKSRQERKRWADAVKKSINYLEQEAMINAQKRNAIRGNLASLEFLLKSIGEHPDQTTDSNDSVTNINVGNPEYTE